MVPGRARAGAGAGESSSGQTTRSAQGVHLCICVTGAAAADPPADAADPPADADLLFMQSDNTIDSLTSSSLSLLEYLEPYLTNIKESRS